MQQGNLIGRLLFEDVRHHALDHVHIVIFRKAFADPLISPLPFVKLIDPVPLLLGRPFLGEAGEGVVKIKAAVDLGPIQILRQHGRIQALVDVAFDKIAGHVQRRLAAP